MPEPIPYFCRVCWNSNQWRRPTGEAAKLESKTSYAVQFGFGFEEWLNRPEWTIDGQRYAFLQPVNKSRENKLRDVLHLTLAREQAQAGKSLTTIADPGNAPLMQLGAKIWHPWNGKAIPKIPNTDKEPNSAL